MTKKNVLKIFVLQEDVFLNPFVMIIIYVQMMFVCQTENVYSIKYLVMMEIHVQMIIVIQKKDVTILKNQIVIFARCVIIPNLFVQNHQQRINTTVQKNMTVMEKHVP